MTLTSGLPFGEGGRTLPRNTEIELKLSAEPKSLARIRRTAFWSGPGRAQTRVLDSVYYDTVGHKLRERGFTLRVRKTGRRYLQTVKYTGRSGNFERQEFESYLPDGKPDLLLVDDGMARSRLADVSSADLKPVFTTHVRRSRKLYTSGDGATVEIALDNGEVRNEQSSTPLSEVELELKQGTPETLFDMARELSAVVPLRLQVQSKPDMGYDLTRGVHEEWQPAGKLALDPAMTTEDALDAIVDFCANHILHNDQCARLRTHVEGVHQVRVGLRRLRSGLDLFRNLLPEEQYRWVNGEAKAFAAALGPARDLDVFRSEILPPVASRLATTGDFGTIDTVAGRLQDDAYALVQETLSSRRFTDFMIELMRWRKTRSWRNQPVTGDSSRLFAPIGDLAKPLLARRHRSVMRKGEDFANLSLERRHEVRIALKKLRYATDFFASLYSGKAADTYLKRLGRLQNDLGHLNDVATIAGVIAKIEESGTTVDGARAAGALLGWYEREIADGDGRLVRDWQKFAQVKPFWK